MEWWFPRTGKEREGLVFNGYRVSVSNDREVLDMDCGEDCTTS